MNFIFGCWSHRRTSVDCRIVVEGMARFFVQQGVAHRLFPLGPHFAVGVASFTTPRDKLDRCLVETDNLIAVGDVALYDEDAVDSRGNVKVTPAEELLRVAGAHKDAAVLAGLNGDFAVAVYDKGAQSITLIRDHCGNVPLHYSQYGEACAFSSLVPPLLLTPWASTELDRIALASFLLMMAPGQERSYYTSVKTVLPASLVVLFGEDTAASRKYWYLRPAPGIANLKADEAYACVREQLVRATIARTRGFERVGVELSGGLDSSTVTGIVCSHFPDRRIEAACNVLPAGLIHHKGDERTYMSAMAERYPNLSLNLDTAIGADPLSGAKLWSTWLAAPVADGFFYRQRRLISILAAAGAQCVLSGEGGDYCVSMGAHTFLTECFIRRRPGLFLREMRRQQALRNLNAARVLRTMLVMNILPQNLVRWARRLVRGTWDRSFPIAPGMARNAELAEHLINCDFFAVYATRSQTMQQEEQTSIAALDVWNQAAQRTLNATLDITVRHPLFDRQLLEVSNAIDSQHKVSTTHDRMLIRCAAQPFLPDTIAHRSDKGWYSPDFRERLRDVSGRLRLHFESARRISLFHDLVDETQIQCELERLTTKQAATAFDTRVVYYILLPYRLAEFLIEHAS